MYTVHGTTWLLHHASVTIVYTQHESSEHWSPWHVSHALTLLSSYHSSIPQWWHMYTSNMTALPYLGSSLQHLSLSEHQPLQYDRLHRQPWEENHQYAECERSESYLVSMRDNLTTHHHINSYYNYLCTQHGSSMHQLGHISQEALLHAASACVMSPWQLISGLYRLCIKSPKLIDTQKQLFPTYSSL